MKLSCYILDDEPHALDLLQAYIERTPGLSLAGRQTKPVAALEELGRLAPDIAFVDIDMPELSGLEVARIVGDQTAIIFTTSFRQFGPEAFELKAVDYLLKPFLYSRFLEAVQRVRPLKQLSALFVKTGIKGQLQKIDIDSIVYISGLQAYVEIHTTAGRTVTNLSLAELLLQLPPNGFSRIHKSFIINHDHIRLMETRQVYLTDAIALPIGRSYQQAFFQKLAPSLLTGRQEG